MDPNENDATEIVPPDATMPAPPVVPIDLPGAHAGEGAKYDVGAEVARGGMGMVLRAHDRAIRRGVAMKVMLNPDSTDAADRFVAEAQVTGQLEHPAIVPIYDLGVGADGRPFYTMKFVDGVTLRTVLEGLRMRDPDYIRDYPLARLLTIFQKVCDALAFAHARGVIHRDLKPDNIMIGAYGEVLVMDWGLAKIIGETTAATPGEVCREDDPAATGPEEAGRRRAAGRGVSVGPAISTARHDQGDTGRTVSGHVLGTPNFMSPEQANGRVEELDARSDIFALGGILHHLLTLELPFKGRDLEAVLEKVRRADVRPAVYCTAGDLRLPHLPGGRVPESLSAVAAKAMARDPADRYASVPDLQRDLEAYQNGFATSAEQAGILKQMVLLIKRHRTAALGLAAVLLVGVALGAKALVEQRRAVRHGQRAEAALARLKQTAPGLISQAQSAIEGGKLDEALAKIEFALQIDPDNNGYLLLRAQVLQATLRLDDAVAAYRALLTRLPGDAVRRNLEVCERVLRQNLGPAGPDIVGLRALYNVMTSEGRMAQALPIGTRLGLGRADVDQLLTARLEGWRKLAGWDKLPESQRAVRYGDGSIALNFDHVSISDLSSLKALPIVELSLRDTAVRDLSPLAGLRLTKLYLDGTGVTDLSPLRAMPLRSLFVWTCRDLSSLEPLRGLPLEELNIGQTKVTDFSPLRDSPIKSLMMECLAPTNLDMLTGLPLERLTALACPPLADISALRQMPRLRWLELARCESIADFAPLGACTNLELLTLPRSAGRVEVLRQLSQLRALGHEMTSLAPACEFLQAQWNGDPKLARDVALVRRARAAFAAAGPEALRPEQALACEDGTLDLRFMSRKSYTNLVPFAGLPVSALDIGGTGIRDLSPLRGMPLRVLKANDTPIADLTPLSTCASLATLHAYKTRVRDLSPLRDLPLDLLYLGGTPVTDIAPVARAPLRVLTLDHTPLRDVSPLVNCRTLENLSLPAVAENIGVLRQLPRLSRISFNWDGAQQRPAQTAAEFWGEYDGR